MSETPEILKKEEVYQTPLWAHGRTKVFIYKIKPKSKPAECWEVPVSKDIVVAVALDKNKSVFLVEQWRPAWEKHVLAIPGGGIEVENASEDYRRNKIVEELREEIGYQCDEKNLEKLATILCSGRIKSRQHIYLATKIKPSNKHPENYERLNIRSLPFDKALEMVMDRNTETTGYTLLGLLLAKTKLDRSLKREPQFY